MYTVLSVYLRSCPADEHSFINTQNCIRYTLLIKLFHFNNINTHSQAPARGNYIEATSFLLISVGFASRQQKKKKEREGILDFDREIVHDESNEAWFTET